MTADQKEIIYHSLGSSSGIDKMGYRNYFFTEAEDPVLADMVKNGWMLAGRYSNDRRDRYFHVTRAGTDAAGIDLTDNNPQSKAILEALNDE